MTFRKSQTRSAKSSTVPIVSQKYSGGIQNKVGYQQGIVQSHEGINLYSLDPLAQLRMIMASSFFGEPQFYVSGNERVAQTEAAIDAALHYDFGGTLQAASEIRNEYWMKLNPQVILVRAACHPDRQAYTSQHPGMFHTLQDSIAWNPRDLISQIEYYLASFETRKTGKKASRMPDILKRTVRYRLEQFRPYHMKKYLNDGIGIIDVVRLVHAHNDIIDEIMKTGNVTIDEEDRTWMSLSSQGASWSEIINYGLNLTHQDILSQLRNIAAALSSSEFEHIVSRLVNGATTSRVFPYKYWIAYKRIQAEAAFPNKHAALNALEMCLTASVAAQPSLGGSVGIFVDNSGSMSAQLKADGYDVSFADVANLSGAMTAFNADRGRLFSFGTTLEELSYSRSDGIIHTARNLARLDTGWGTNMHLFWQQAIAESYHYDTVFCYSDVQASNMDVQSMYRVVRQYRERVNPHVNVVYVQCAGYGNGTPEPQHSYRAVNLSSWTGKEVKFARAVFDIWDQYDMNNGI